MITLILLSCFTIIASAVPVRPNIIPPLLSQGGAAQAANQKPALLSPSVEQPQPGPGPQQPSPRGGPQLVPSLQHYTWSPLGDNRMIIPLQPSVQGSQPALTQLPLSFHPYGYVPVFLSPFRNQLFSPYGFPMILGVPLPQTPADLPSNSPAPSVETPSGAAPPGDAPQPIQQQQQQNPQVVYMLQQPLSSPLGSLSSEEFEMAAKMGNLGVYMSSVLTNLPTGAAQPVNRAAGPANPGEAGAAPTVVTSSAGVPRTQGLAGAGPQPNTNSGPVGLEKAGREAATVQTPAQPKLQPTQGNHV